MVTSRRCIDFTSEKLDQKGTYCELGVARKILLSSSPCSNDTTSTRARAFPENRSNRSSPRSKVCLYLGSSEPQAHPSRRKDHQSTQLQNPVQALGIRRRCLRAPRQIRNMASGHGCSLGLNQTRTAAAARYCGAALSSCSEIPWS